MHLKMFLYQHKFACIEEYSHELFTKHLQMLGVKVEGNRIDKTLCLTSVFTINVVTFLLNVIFGFCMLFSCLIDCCFDIVLTTIINLVNAMQ